MKKRILQIYRPLLIAIVIVLSQYLYGDIFYLDNGKSVEGSVISEDDKIVTIVTGSTQLTLRKENILRVEKPNVDSEEQLYKDAQSDFLRGDEVTALEKCIKLLVIKPKFSDAKTLALSIFNVLQNKAELRFEAKNYQESLRIYLVLYNALPSVYKDEPRLDLREKNIKIQIINCRENIAKELSVSQKEEDKIEAVKQFEEALKLNPEEAEFFYEYGNVLLSLKRYKDSEEAFNKALLLTPDISLISKIRENLNKIFAERTKPLEQAAANPSAIAEAPPTGVLLPAAAKIAATEGKAETAFSPGPNIIVSTPVTKPIIESPKAVAEAEDKNQAVPKTPAALPNPTNQPTPPTDGLRLKDIPQRVISYKDIPSFERLRMRYAKEGAKGILNDLIEQSKGINFMSLIVWITLIIVINWILPYFIVKVISNKGNVKASQWRPTVKKWGLIPFILFLFIVLPGVFKQTRSRKNCPYCKKPIDNIEEYPDLNFYHCPYCRENITPIYNLEEYIRHLIKNVEVDAGRNRSGDLSSQTEKDAMIKFIQGLVTFGVRERSSDLHIEPGAGSIKIRVRIDGILTDHFSLRKGTDLMLSSAIKVMAKMDIVEKRRPQDGRMNTWVDGNNIDIRINTSPTPFGEKISLRLLNQKAIMVDSTELGLEGDTLERFESSIKKSRGLILITGPTGSGKSTTIYIALKALNTGEKNIVTIEDPIEYNIDGITQMQVNPKIDFTFGTGLRSILRQDPDIIMIGEIRDKETADIAIEASMTGHLVFSTLHTIDTATAFMRFQELGIEPKRVATATVAIIAQRLLRLNCTECKKKYSPPQKDLEMLGFSGSVKDVIFMKGTGCPHCRNTGFYGRTGIFEIMVINDEIRSLFDTNISSTVIREIAKKHGMHTLKEVGLIKAMEGLTTIEEVVRTVI